MSNTLRERPTFSAGQYIGAADLNAAVDYARDETERLALSGRSWGIATGLALVEIPDATGGVQMFIEPGIAWDGYGRAVVVLAPAPVTPDLFIGLPSGNQTVWLRYEADGTQAVAPGFRTCGAGDPYTRIAETYAIEAGNRTVTQRSDGLVIAGAGVPDPRDMLIAIDQNAAVVLDGSAAHQSFPDDTARWLIPVGIASYVPGSPGSFAARSPTQLVTSRTTRRMLGTVAESVLAADGVLRLRDRQSDNPAGLTDDALDGIAAIQPGDLAVDPNNLSRLIGNELVWVEGNLRVTGNARLYGSQLELRDGGGGEDNAPEFLRRGTSAGNTLGGQDLQICIGSSVTGTPGADRLTVGVLTTPSTAMPSTAPDGALNEVMVVRTDGRVAIGTNVIDNYSTLANTLVVATTADTGITVVSGSGKTGNLFFADGTGTQAQKDGFVAYDHGKQQLALGAAATTMLVVTPNNTVIGPADPAGFSGVTDQLVVASDGGAAGIAIAGKPNTVDSIDFANGTLTTGGGFIRYFLQHNQMQLGTNSAPRVAIDQDGRVGIGTTGPASYDSDANQLVVAAASSGGITIAGAAGTAGRLNFADGTGAPHAGYIRYDQAAARLEFGVASAANVFIRAGRLGIGTSTPSTPVEIVEGTTALSLSASWVQAYNTGNPSALLLQPNGAFAGVGLPTGQAPAATLHVRANGAASPALRVDAAGTAPTALLQVIGTLPGPGWPTLPDAAQHVVRFENAATGAANVLALTVNASEAADTECRFVTFYDGNGNDLGAITGAGTPLLPGWPTVTYQSVGADYAEAVPRAPGVTPIGAGKVVGVHGGTVSLVTEGADAVFVTSAAPAMLARMPPGGKRDGHEVLAFLGQVPVTVTGPVQRGDVIVASGKDDGKARAVALTALHAEDLALIIGRAWENLAAGKTGLVNALVGPGVASAAAAGVLLARQAAELKRLAALVARRRTADKD